MFLGERFEKLNKRFFQTFPNARVGTNLVFD